MGRDHSCIDRDWEAVLGGKPCRDDLYVSAVGWVHCDTRVSEPNILSHTGPPSRRTRTQIFSIGVDRNLKSPLVLHEAEWSPKLSS